MYNELKGVGKEWFHEGICRWYDGLACLREGGKYDYRWKGVYIIHVGWFSYSSASDISGFREIMP